MVLLGDGSKENGDDDHQPVELIETTKSGRPGGRRILALLGLVSNQSLRVTRAIPCTLRYWFLPVASCDSSSVCERPVFLSPTICCSQ